VCDELRLVCRGEAGQEVRDLHRGWIKRMKVWWGNDIY